MAAEFGHFPSRAYLDQSGQFHLNGASLFSGLDGNEIDCSQLISNLNRQVPGVTGQVQPGAIGQDDVVAVFSIPAGLFSAATKGIYIEAEGVFAATVNTKRIKLWFNATTAVVGSAITGGTLLADTGAVTTNGGSWWVGGAVYKRGAAGSNTQTTVSEGAIAGATHTGISPSVDTTAVENAPILVAVTINNTTVVTDAGLTYFEVNGPN